MDKSQNILTIKNLSIRFNNTSVKALDKVNIKIPRGKTLGLVGESGSGKSLTSLAIMGILPYNAIVVDGEIQYSSSRISQDLLKISEKNVMY